MPLQRQVIIGIIIIMFMFGVVAAFKFGQYKLAGLILMVGGLGSILFRKDIYEAGKETSTGNLTSPTLPIYWGIAIILAGLVIWFKLF